jgi:hypothetical protein
MLVVAEHSRVSSSQPSAQSPPLRGIARAGAVPAETGLAEGGTR